MRNLDQRTINEFGIPGIVLMENAGRAVVDVIEKYFSKTELKRVIIFAGAGNNGGDGMVIGRHLVNRGLEVIVFLLSPKEKIKGDARINLELYEKLGPVYEIQARGELLKFHPEIVHGDLIIDAIFGTGLSSEIKGFYREIIEYINSLPIPVLSVDIPSGVDATTGKILGAAVKADFTVTFGLPKIGLVIYPGIDYAGIMEVADISIPRYLVEEENISVNLLEVEELIPFIKPRDPNSHKGSYGHLLIIAGSPGKTGAAYMTSEAALKIGAGLVTLGIPASLNPILEVKLTEVMT
ncbi:MAG: NAD(P)H-hydrate epimerase, partial [Desulfobacterota bacterium]|nr:NAD(P)H-hydrate epimerase [Thermodesulfobacteriota bacterium]